MLSPDLNPQPAKKALNPALPSVASERVVAGLTSYLLQKRNQEVTELKISTSPQGDVWSTVKAAPLPGQKEPIYLFLYVSTPDASSLSPMRGKPYQAYGFQIDQKGNLVSAATQKFRMLDDSEHQTRLALQPIPNLDPTVVDLCQKSLASTIRALQNRR